MLVQADSELQHNFLNTCTNVMGFGLMMKETIILNAQLKKDSHINVTSLADPIEYQHMIIKYLSVVQ